MFEEERVLLVVFFFFFHFPFSISTKYMAFLHKVILKQGKVSSFPFS